MVSKFDKRNSVVDCAIVKIFSVKNKYTPKISGTLMSIYSSHFFFKFGNASIVAPEKDRKILLHNIMPVALEGYRQKCRTTTSYTHSATSHSSNLNSGLPTKKFKIAKQKSFCSTRQSYPHAQRLVP